jgi:DNA-binding MarR family transcriptional regulator
MSLLLTRTARRLQEALIAMLRAEFHLPLMGWQVLSYIAVLSETSAKEVRKRAQLPADQVSRVVDDLVSRKWVIRKRNPTDRRHLALSLTVQGQAVFRKIDLFARAVNYEMLRVFSSREQKAIDRLCAKLDRRSQALLGQPNSWRGFYTSVRTVK